MPFGGAAVWPEIQSASSESPRPAPEGGAGRRRWRVIDAKFEQI
jgi:hypothetical protein